MTMNYASGTNVPEDRSRSEIERALIRYGASDFGYMRQAEKAIIVFRYRKIAVRLSVPFPDQKDNRFTKTPTGRPRRGNISEIYEAEVRRRWRALALAVKAKLVIVQDGVASFEEEFLPYMVTDEGMSVAQHMAPQVRAAMEGRAPLMLTQGDLGQSATPGAQNASRVVGDGG